MTRYLCCDESRRARVAEHPTLNGIDWLDVLDHEAPPGVARQQWLIVHLLKPLEAVPQLMIEGAPAVTVAWAGALGDAPELAPLALADADRIIVVRAEPLGGFGRYTLTLRHASDDARPPIGFDPRLATLDFSFKVECVGDTDCAEPACDTAAAPAPAVPFDTLARDYAGFRRLLIDRMRALLPGWTTSNPADLGITLAELIAYVGDQLAWKQDAVAAEAYLATARRRVSLRRHALLVDYRTDEGRAAEALVQLRLVGGVLASEITLDGVRFATGGAAPEWFEPADDAAVRVDPDHHAMPLYDWGDGRCCLAAGATSATLLGHFPALRPGDWLILEEAIDPATGLAADANPATRHAVQLSAVRARDGGATPLVDPLPDPPLAITEIAWHAEHATPFTFCLATESAPGVVATVARGNLVRAVHGLTVLNERLTAVPEGRFVLPPAPGDRCDRAEPRMLPPRYRPTLAQAPLVHAAGADGVVRAALRLIDADGELWTAEPDLLLSGPDDRHLVAEVGDDGRAVLRFGDGRFGRSPRPGESFRATYRVGGGTAGNVGADAIARVVASDPRLAGARNPLPAAGGTAPESAAQIRRRVPHAFRRQERAVTLADWEEAGAHLPGVTRAAARSRWTGSWRTTFLMLDRAGGGATDADARSTALATLDRLRLAGRDLSITEPVAVPIELALTVCVAEGALRPAVASELTRALGGGIGADGRPALFHPDRLSFGQSIPLSPVLAEARSVPGVASVEVTRFVRADAEDDPRPLADGLLRLGPLEIARLARPVALKLHGGR